MPVSAQASRRLLAAALLAGSSLACAQSPAPAEGGPVANRHSDQRPSDQRHSAPEAQAPERAGPDRRTPSHTVKPGAPLRLSLRATTGADGTPYLEAEAEALLAAEGLELRLLLPDGVQITDEALRLDEAPLSPGERRLHRWRLAAPLPPEASVSVIAQLRLSSGLSLHRAATLSPQGTPAPEPIPNRALTLPSGERLRVFRAQ